MKKFTRKIITWIKNNKKEAIILGIILVVAAALRLYKIDQYMTFLGDEGRDVIVVRRLLVEGHPPLIGPGTSIGQMYLGPLYYYMMAIPLLLANFSPVGPAVQIAIIGILTVAFVWWVGRKWFGKWVGIIAAGFYAISPTVIIYSRSSWNPNIMPFFALLSIYSIWEVWKERKFNWLIVLGISYAFVLQSHYLGLLLAPTLFLFWVLTLKSLKLIANCKLEIGNFIKKSVLGLGFFLILMSPLVIFDIRHNWMNAKAMYTFFTMRQTTVSIRPWTAIPKLPEMLNLLDSSIVSAKNKIASYISTLVIISGIITTLLYGIVVNRKKWVGKINPAFWLLVSWLGFGLVGFGLYKQNIYDHYFGFIFAVPFLLTGFFVSKLLLDGKIAKFVGIILIVYLVAINLLQNPLRKEPNRLLFRSEHVAAKIVSEAGGIPMNLAVIADTNYEAGYEYFVELYGGNVLEILATDKATFANQLFVVCELIPTSKCDPTHNPKAQVANFGWSKVENTWEVDGVIIYKLIHTK